jgi:hypothetical protein
MPLPSSDFWELVLKLGLSFRIRLFTESFYGRRESPIPLEVERCVKRPLESWPQN